MSGSVSGRPKSGSAMRASRAVVMDPPPGRSTAGETLRRDGARLAIDVVPPVAVHWLPRSDGAVRPRHADLDVTVLGQPDVERHERAADVAAAHGDLARLHGPACATGAHLH